MTFDEYQQLAARTASMDVPHEIRQATFALGLVCEATEVFELFARSAAPSPGKLTKELGDVLWYAAALCTEHGLSFSEVVSHTPEQLKTALTTLGSDAHLKSLLIGAGKTSDYMKKVVGHGHELDRARLADGLRSVVYDAHSIGICEGVYLRDVMAANIEKLKARYPAGFSSEASINRTV